LTRRYLFQIGFIQPSEARVNAIHARLLADGLSAPPPRRLHGATFYFTAPGGFTIEVQAIGSPTE
jgi:lactoylglutathione lyase